MKKNILLFLLILLSQITVAKENNDENLKPILKIQDARERKSKKLISFLSNKNNEIKLATIIAFANIQDTTVIYNLLKFLENKNEKIKMTTAFAIGQIAIELSDVGKKNLEEKFFEKKLFTTNRMIEEFGKFCSVNGLDKFVNIFSKENDEEKIASVILAISRSAMRRITSNTATQFVLDKLNSNNEIILENCFYSLQRIGKCDLIENNLEIIIPFSLSENSFVQQNVATLFGKIANEKTLFSLSTMIENDDWKIVVNSINSLGKYDLKKYQGVFFILLPLLESDNEHILFSSIKSISNLDFIDSINLDLKTEIWNKLTNIAKNEEGNFSIYLQSEASFVLAKLFKNKAKEIVFPKAKSAKQLNSKLIQSLGFYSEKNTLDEIFNWANSDDKTFSYSGIEAAKIYFSLNKNQNEISFAKEKIMELLLTKKDIAVRSNLISLIADTIFAEELFIEPLIQIYKTQTNETGIEVKQEILSTLAKIKSKSSQKFLESELTNSEKTLATLSANALKEITGKDFSKKIHVSEKPKKEIDFKLLDEIKDTTLVEIKTQVGNFKIELYKNFAPLTVLSFLNLTKSGFYNNTIFHRVVPNFVVQGGDQRGDGFGGPNYTLCTETSLLKYDDEGIFGMASAGKDTEGSQFFITHSPSPHLDGRYTIFGKVVEGMEIVNEISVGSEVYEIGIVK